MQEIDTVIRIRCAQNEAYLHVGMGYEVIEGPEVEYDEYNLQS